MGVLKSSVPLFPVEVLFTLLTLRLCVDDMLSYSAFSATALESSKIFENRDFFGSTAVLSTQKEQARLNRSTVGCCYMARNARRLERLY